MLKFIDEAGFLGYALRAGARTIGVYLFLCFCCRWCLGTRSSLLKAPGQVPVPDSVQGVYWAIVTMTTVGYGYLVPQTALGRLLASVVMMLGFGIIAIPTGLLTVSGVRHQQKRRGPTCAACGRQGHREDARHCDQCGASLPARA